LKKRETEATFGQFAYRHLKRQLLREELVPGDSISAKQLAADLGMSRTPIREAIRRLEIEGVLEAFASNGTFVRYAERSTIVEIYEMRAATESFALRKAIWRFKLTQIRQLQEICHLMLETIRLFRDSGAFCLAGQLLQKYLNEDMAFHLMLVSASESRRLRATYEDLNLRSAVFGVKTHQRNLGHVARAWQQHERVVRFMRQRNAGAAVRALEKHMFTSMQAALEACDTQVGEYEKPMDKKILAQKMLLVN